MRFMWQLPRCSQERTLSQETISDLKLESAMSSTSPAIKWSPSGLLIPSCVDPFRRELVSGCFFIQIQLHRFDTNGLILHSERAMKYPFPRRIYGTLPRNKKRPIAIYWTALSMETTKSDSICPESSGTISKK